MLTKAASDELHVSEVTRLNLEHLLSFKIKELSQFDCSVLSYSFDSHTH